MKLKIILCATLLVLTSKINSQTKKATDKTEVLTYVSAVFDPASEETQVEFKSNTNEKRIFYYSKQDVIKLEEQFFNTPVMPPTAANLNLTKMELVGKKYNVTYMALTENASKECCFKMKQCLVVGK